MGENSQPRELPCPAADPTSGTEPTVWITRRTSGLRRGANPGKACLETHGCGENLRPAFRVDCAVHASSEEKRVAAFTMASTTCPVMSPTNPAAPMLSFLQAVASRRRWKKASSSTLIRSLWVDHMAWGAPGTTFGVAFLTSLAERYAESVMGTIWSSSP